MSDYILLRVLPRMENIFPISISLLIYTLWPSQGHLSWLSWFEEILDFINLHMSCLFLIDLALIGTSVSKMDIDSFSGRRNISHIDCGTQIFFFLALGMSKYVLTLMAYDLNVVICCRTHSLHELSGLPTTNWQ